MRLALGAVVICAVVYGFDLRDDHQWGDDFAQYIAHAQNLIAGKPYIDTGYLSGVGVFQAPRAYPPVTSFLLVPILKFRGLDWRWLKLPQVLGALIAIFVWAMLARPYMANQHAALLAIAIGLHPTTRIWADFVMSDLIFLAQWALAFYLLERWVDRHEPNDRRWLHGAIIGLVIGSSIATRTIGVILPPFVPVIEWIRTRRWSGLSVAALGVSAAIAAAGFLWLPEQFDYLSGEAPTPLLARMLRRGQWYTDDLIAFLPGIGEARARALFSLARHAFGYSDVGPVLATGLQAAIAVPIIAALAAIVVAGFLKKSPWRSFDLFGAPLFVLMVMYESFQPRYLFPLLPVIYFYFFCGMERLVPLIGRASVTGLAVLAIAANLTLDPFRQYSAGVEDPAARHCLEFIRESTPPDAIITFAKPRALAMLTGRRSYLAGLSSDEDFLLTLKRGAATYMLAMSIIPDATHDYVARHPEGFRRVYDADGFELFEILSARR